MNLRDKLKPLLPFFFIPFILMLAYFLINIAPPFPDEDIRIHFSGIHNLVDIDFENFIYVTDGHLEVLSYELVGPEVFGPYLHQEYHECWDDIDHNSYLTSRMIFYVEDGKWYTFTRRSINHSYRLFVNGSLLYEIGQPGETPQTAIPDTGRITFTAQGVDGIIEIIQQSSNHFHRYGEPWRHAHWRIGTGTALADAVRAEHYQTNIILGCFLVLAFLFILLFFMHGKNRAALYFSLFCLVWFARIGVTGEEVFSVLLPQLDWFLRLHIQYISIPASAALTLAIINVLFPNVIHKLALYILYGVSAIFAVLFLFMDTLTMSHMIDWVYVIYGSAIVYILFCLVIRQFIKRRTINLPQIFFIFGLVIFFLSVLADFGYLPEIHVLPMYQLTGIAMLVFALCEASAIFITTMREREETIEDRHRLSAEVAVLKNISQLKVEHYETIQSHIAETRRARHDLRHHLSVFRSYIDTGDIKNLDRYLDEYIESLHGSSESAYCENFTVNSILQYYIDMAKNDDITIDVSAVVPVDMNINDTDLCIVFGNCIENAVEACRKFDGERYIKIRSRKTNEMFTIIIANSFDGNIKKEGGKFLSRKREGEGIGISSVKSIVKKYGESAQFEVDGNEFKATIILCAG